MDKGADLEIKNNYGMIPYDMIVTSYAGEEKSNMLSIAKPENIFQAVEQEKPQWVRQFLKQGAKINDKDEYERTLLGIAMDSYNVKYMAYWLTLQGANPVGENSWGEPLYKAAINSGYLKLVKSFFEKGAPSKADEGLLLASAANYEDIIRYFIDKGANVKVKNEEGYTPLYYAVANGMTTLVETLLKKGALVNETFDNDNTVLHMAVNNYYTDIIDLLLKNGANPNLKNADDKNALDLATDLAEESLIDAIAPYMKKTGK